MDEKANYWQKIVGNKVIKIDLEKLKKACEEAFSKESDNYKQRLVYDLLDAVKNMDQNRFFYILLRAINKPEKEFKNLIEVLKNTYDVMPEEAFMNYAYSIIIGIMSTYKGESE